ncbi:hypothetical protein GH733_016786 [Mirounga leonina]|nr:hypothetical protein GH733_016786 [Mirounga leonina]
MVCPESCPNRTLLSVTPRRNLTNALSSGKTFSPRSYLITHKGIPTAVLTPPHPKRIHTRGLFKCPQCQQSFRPYARHIGRQKAHNGEKPQQRSHTGENVYICLECGKNMSWRAFLGLHQRNPI